MFYKMPHCALYFALNTPRVVQKDLLNNKIFYGHIYFVI